MAAFGRPQYADQIYQDFIEQFDPPHLALRYNVHRGISGGVDLRATLT